MSGFHWPSELQEKNQTLSARVRELEAAIREYLGEYDTPAKDYAYRAQCRERLRKLVEKE